MAHSRSLIVLPPHAFAQSFVASLLNHHVVVRDPDKTLATLLRLSESSWKQGDPSTIRVRLTRGAQGFVDIQASD